MFGFTILVIVAVAGLSLYILLLIVKISAKRTLDRRNKKDEKKKLKTE